MTPAPNGHQHGYTALPGDLVQIVISQDDYAWLMHCAQSAIERMRDDEPAKALRILGAMCAAGEGDPERIADPLIETGIRVLQGDLLINIAKLARAQVEAERQA